MRRWQVCFLLVVTLALAVGESRNGRGTAASVTSAASVQATVSFQVGPTTAGGLEKHVTGGTEARIEIRNAGLTATTDGNGRAQIFNIPLANEQTSGPATSDIVVTAPGYAPFTFLHVPLDGSVILTPILGPEPRTDDLGRLSAPPAGVSPTATPTAAATSTPSALPGATAADTGTPAASATAISGGPLSVTPTVSPNSAASSQTDAADGTCTTYPGCYCAVQGYLYSYGSVDG